MKSSSRERWNSGTPTSTKFVKRSLSPAVLEGNGVRDLAGPAVRRLQDPQIEPIANREQPLDLRGGDHDVVIEQKNGVVPHSRFIEPAWTRLKAGNFAALDRSKRSTSRHHEGSP
jgi:hypothetical protein